MKIGLDLDGVLYPWHKYFYEEVRKRDELYSTYSYEEFWMNIRRLEEVNKEWMWRIVNTPKFYNKEPIDKNLLNILNELSLYNELYYITSRPESAHKITRTWVDRNNLPQKENLYMVVNGKKDIVANLNIEFYVEDRIDNYEVLKDITKVLLIKQPWNDYGKDVRMAYNDTLDALIYLLNRSNSSGFTHTRN